MSAENPQKETPLEKPSLKETLAAKRREAEESAALLASEAAEKKAEELKAREEQESGELKQQITELDEKKKRLEDLITKIKDAYKGVDEAVGDFKEADKEIKKMMKEYKDVLASPLEENQDPINTKKRKKPDAEGGGEEPHHDFRDELIGSEQADNFQETAGFKEKQQTLNEKIAAVLAEKEKIKKELPDADLSVGSSKKEGKDNEDVIVAKMQEAIAKLQKEIADLVDQTPEKKAERKNEAACKDFLENSGPFCRLPFRKDGSTGHLTADNLRSMPLFIGDSKVPQLLAQFGEDAFKKATFKIILPKFEKLMSGTVTLNEASKAKLAEMLEAKIERDVLEQKYFELNKDGDQGRLYEDRNKILQEANDARHSLERFVRFSRSETYEKYKTKRVKITDTRTDDWGSYSDKRSGELQVLDLDGENPNSENARRRFEDADTKQKDVQKQIDGLKKPLLNFGRAGREYEQRLDGLQAEYRGYKKRADEAKVDLDKYKQDYARNPTSNLMEVSRFIDSVGLEGNTILSPILESTVEGVMKKVEELLKKRAERKPDQALDDRVNKYLEMKYALEKANGEYERKRVYHV
ncbi:MAG: hypothetical protein WCO16_02795 [bacterium]